ncbi:MAG: TfoX/Sxy family protein [Bacteroidota bacterium]
MMKLSEMNNIGNALAGKLEEAGIASCKDLIESGSENAFIRLRSIDPNVCINMLYALEGAVQGIRWHHIDEGRKAELREFFNKMKT